MHKPTKTDKPQTDREVVLGLQAHDATVEERFYAAAKRYFVQHYADIFFDKDRKQEVFQDAFLRLWTNIENRQIRATALGLERQQRDGSYAPMTCSLMTFLMAIARNSHREICRSSREVLVPEYYDDSVPCYDEAETDDVQEQKARIVDECLQTLPPRCLQILTLFYYEEKSLDDILLVRASQHESKGGLKTAKYKCMQTLRERIELQLRRYHISA